MVVFASICDGERVGLTGFDGLNVGYVEFISISDGYAVGFMGFDGIIDGEESCSTTGAAVGLPGLSGGGLVSSTDGLFDGLRNCDGAGLGKVVGRLLTVGAQDGFAGFGESEGDAVTFP